MKFLTVFICFWELAVINGNTVYRFGPGGKFMCHCKTVHEECNKQTGNCPNGCASAWFGPGCQYRDLVHLQGSIVSMTETNGNDAQKTVDGDENSCSGTKKLSNPWWKVRLPQNETITELYIISKDKHLEHFINTSVFIENVPERHTQDKTQESQLCYKGYNLTPDKASFVIRCDNPSAGNQVRILLEGKRNKLVLCDVRINGGRNLAFGKETTQSSTYRDSASYASGQAVDADMATCSLTKDFDKSAWWNAFLRFTAIVQHITVTTKIEYRTGVKGKLFNAKHTREHSWEDDGNSQHAVYEEANGIEIRPKSGNRIIICETELYGDCAENLCGLDCKTKCHCKSMTVWTRISANCSTSEMEVNEGRYSTSAKDLGQESVCDDGSYGKPCTKCGYCLHNKSCYKTNGTCPSGCQSGYTGDLCNMVCSVGKYGEQCAHNCSEKCYYQQCDKANGKCKHGCKDGWFGDKCEEKCTAGSYGRRCLNTCGTNCAGGNTFCNHVDGTCTKGCIAGWRYKKCDAECDLGKYGDKCAETCSRNCRDRYRCNKVNGRCVNGCKNGWQGEQCEDACTTGTYGQDCKQQCSGNCQGRNEFCNSEDGTCKDFACVAGWKGKRCTEKCDVRMYGDKCTKRCNKNCKNGKCYHIDGKCEQGCKDGWHGDTCEDVCENFKWGVGCKNFCGSCSDGTCDPVDGHCRGNCSIGFKFTPRCNQECDYGFYGLNCSETCGSCNNGTDCDKVTGVCANICSSGYSGDLCISDTPASAAINIPIGIGAAVVLLLGVGLVVLFELLRRRKRRHNDDHVYVNDVQPSRSCAAITMTPALPDQHYTALKTVAMNDTAYETIEI